MRILNVFRIPRPAIAIYFAAAGVLVFGFIFGESTCIFRNLTGWSCPGCGMIHAMLAMAQGQFGAAWNFNPASFLVAPILLWTGIHKTKGAF
jgi:hypothetical protein